MSNLRKDKNSKKKTRIFMFHPSHLWSKNQREPNWHGILESSGIKRQNQKTRFENTNRWTTRKKNFSKFIEHVFHYTSQRCWEGNFRRTKKIRANEPWKKFHVRYVAPSRIPLERLIGSLSLSLSPQLKYTPRRPFQSSRTFIRFSSIGFGIDSPHVPFSRS